MVGEELPKGTKRRAIKSGDFRVFSEGKLSEVITLKKDETYEWKY